MKDGKLSNSKIGNRPIIFGEVLFDTFPDGAAVLGGAPFNVAWHLKGFGLNPLFISRIGNDVNGRLVKQSMLDWGMDVSGLQDDKQHQTGIVTIALNNGQPSYNILPEQAYDFIDAEQALAQIDTSMSGLLYFGSLINRGSTSRSTLTKIRQLGIPSYIDINLREPWWDAALLDHTIQNARWLKLNDVEIKQLDDHKDLSDAANALIQQHHVDWVILTKGADGALIVTDAGANECQLKKIEQIIDTVGAGDAFSAVTIFGILNQWPVQTILQRAVEFAAKICLQRGATVNDKSFYSKVLMSWQTNR